MNKQMSFKAEKITIKQMSGCFENKKQQKNDPRIDFRVKVDGAVITIFKNQTIEFQGKEADRYFNSWFGINS